MGPRDQRRSVAAGASRTKGQHGASRLANVVSRELALRSIALVRRTRQRLRKWKPRTKASTDILVSDGGGKGKKHDRRMELRGKFLLGARLVEQQTIRIPMRLGQLAGWLLRWVARTERIRVNRRASERIGCWGCTFSPFSPSWSRCLNR